MSFPARRRTVLFYFIHMASNTTDKLHSAIFRTSVNQEKPKSNILENLARVATQDIDELFKVFDTSVKGLKSHTVPRLLEKYGLNTIVREKRKLWPVRLGKIFINPLILLLSALVVISLLTGDPTTAIIILFMVLLSVSIRFYQENQAYNSAQALRSMVKTTCSVLRDGQTREVSLGKVVPGDILVLSAGDIVPADARIITSKDLFISQSLLTGESLPIEKHQDAPTKQALKNPLEFQNLCFMGTNVDSGTARAVIVATGSNTYFGSLAKDVVGQRVMTSFDKGIDRFTWLMMAFMAVMVPIVFLINGFGKHNWWEAFLFGISVAVGLTPEMLPALVTVNLSKGAIAMAKKKVIVKRLSSIQNFGAMNVLCTDKTGTLTQNKVVLIKNINMNNEPDDFVLNCAFLNSLYQTGFKNLLDGAVLKHGKSKNLAHLANEYEKVDELPFDFQRRRLSVIVKNDAGERLLVCKGAVEEVLAISTKYKLGAAEHNLEAPELEKIKTLDHTLSQDGFRVIAVAYRKTHEERTHYTKADEKDLIFLGFMTFFDPPKESAAIAIKKLMQSGVTVKVLTGDNELVTKKVCKDVGLGGNGGEVLLGGQIEQMSDEELQKKVENINIFAKLSPEHKKRVVQALQQANHVVGFLGDGINDAPALRTADVGISVDTAVDISRESADIILLELSLLVLEDGVIEGRKVFGNIIKYIKMGASSNFGNMFSILGASLLLPFLPMTPLQLLSNNLLYDISQTTIPTDNVDEEYIQKPRKWQIGDIGKFMLCIGPISSIFDYATFGVMWYIFHAWQFPAMFQTGWFVESLLTQTLIVHIIRSRKIPFLQTRASKPLLISTGLVMLVGIYLVYSPIARLLGFVHLPALYWPILAGILFSYVALTQIIKTWYIRKFGYN